MDNELLEQRKKLAESYPDLYTQYVMAALSGLVTKHEPKEAIHLAYEIADELIKGRKK